jgi:hypothetical protein
MVVVLEADTLAEEVHVSVAVDTLAEEVRVSVAVDTLAEEVRVSVAVDTLAVAFSILAPEAHVFHHPERVNLKLDPMLSSRLTEESRLSQRQPQERSIVDQIGERQIRRLLRISHATVERCILPRRARHEHFRNAD